VDVESIDLEDFGLDGTIPPEIFDLPSLKYLNLRGNDVAISFYGIVNATNLETLLLGNTGLASIEGVEYATGLQELDISENILTGTLPEAIFQLQDLRVLNIAFNSFTGKFPGLIINLVKFQELNCFQNMFAGELPKEMKSISKLKKLNFGQNQLIGPIPRIIHDMPHLEHIDLSAQTSDDGITGKLLDFANFSHLKRLNLAMNALTGTIPDNLLSGSNITDKK